MLCSLTPENLKLFQPALVQCLVEVTEYFELFQPALDKVNEDSRATSSEMTKISGNMDMVKREIDDIKREVQSEL